MNENALLRFYVKYRRHLPGVLIIVALSLLSGVLKMLSASNWGRAVDFGLAGSNREMVISALFMAAFLTLDCVRTAMHSHIIGRITGKLFVQVRRDGFEKLMHCDMSVMETTLKTGDTASRLSNDISILDAFTGNNLSYFSRLVFQAFFSLIACIFLSWQLSLAYLIILPFSLWLVNKISKPIQTKTRGYHNRVGSAMNVVSETAAGSLTVKAFSAEEQMSEKFAERIESAYRQDVDSQRAEMKMKGVKYAAAVVQTVSLFLIGAMLVEHDLLTVGTFLTFTTLSGYITECFSDSDYIISSVRRVTASAERLFEVLDLPDERNGTVTEAKSDVPCVAQGLRFTYPSANVPAINGLNFTVPCGKKIAVVGASGCGKSTLVKLLCRFYRPEAGELSLFGVDISEWDVDALRRNISIVTQEPQLFYGTVYENVAYGSEGCSRSDVEQALKAAELWEFVSSQDEGMDYMIGEGGGKLSGGQKQRLAIARAMLKNAPLVLLDEATSALDSETEREVQRSLDRLLEGRSAVIIAHRLSTVKNADYIYCMEDGGVIEEGTPDELLARKGKYYEMCAAQGLTGGELND